MADLDQEFTEAMEAVFKQHGETLRRLAVEEKKEKPAKEAESQAALLVKFVDGQLHIEARGYGSAAVFVNAVVQFMVEEAKQAGHEVEIQDRRGQKDGGEQPGSSEPTGASQAT